MFMSPLVRVIGALTPLPSLLEGTTVTDPVPPQAPAAPMVATVCADHCCCCWLLSGGHCWCWLMLLLLAAARGTHPFGIASDAKHCCGGS